MKVCVDIQPAIAQRAGVGRYTHRLVQHLGEHAGRDEIALFCFDFKGSGTPFDAGALPLRRIRCCPGRAAQLAWKTLGWPPFDMFAGGFDAYHFPNFFVPPLRRGRPVVTVHDMSFLRYPQFTESKNLRFLTAHIGKTVDRAAAIITDSRFSGDEICELMNTARSRVFPIYPGIDDGFRSPGDDAVNSVLARHGIRRPYLLTVGTLEPRKNVPFLIELFERLTGFDGGLVIAGMAGWKFDPVLERIGSSKRADRIRYLSYVADEDLPALYAGADLFVLTSFYEGFGFPPLEAMACGTPVVSSCGGSLREVLGHAALLVDGFADDLWIEALRRALGDSTLRSELVARGRQRAARYTWSETARKTWEVYRAVGG